MAMKKISALLLIILCVCFLCESAAAADVTAAEYQSGDYTYSVGADGTAAIISYIGYDERITVPDTLDGHTVAAIEDGAFPFDVEILSISLPAGMQTVSAGAFEGCQALSAIEVSPYNPILASAGGVLFRKTDHTLIAYPLMKEGTAYAVPQGTLAIGPGAFYSCSSLLSVSLPDSIQTIGDGAFHLCSRLESVLVSPDNPCFTSVDGVLFRMEDNALIAYPLGKTVEAYSVPQGTKVLAADTFYDCSFKSVILPDSLRIIGDGAFYSCHNLTSVNLPDGLVSIGDSAFSYCPNLPSVTLPNSLQSIGDAAFAYCHTLAISSLPASLRSIGGGAFASCDAISAFAVSPENPVFTSVDGVLFDRANNTLVSYPSGKGGETYDVAQSVRSIGKRAFAGCSSLVSVSLPSGLASIGDRAFENCSSLTSVTLPAGIQSVAEGAFFYCDSLVSVSLPEGLTSIGDMAFDMCSALPSVNLPEGLQSIGEYAFSSCTGLASVTLPGSLTTIGDWAFSNCQALESIHLPDGLTTIGNGVFCGAPLLAVDIPEGVQAIGDQAFSYCRALSSVSLPRSLRSIGKNAFFNCEELASIDFPDSLRSIGDYAFESCVSLESASLPAGLEAVGDQIFYDCESLAAIEVSPDNPYFTSVGGVLFDKEGKLLVAYPAGKPGETYSVPQGTRAIGDLAFASSGELLSVILPDGLVSIGKDAFSGCYPLESVSFPNSLQSIAKSAFSFTMLASVSLPEGLQSIGDGAFGYCELISANLPASLRFIGDSTFDGNDALTLIVPRDSYAHHYAERLGIPYQFSDTAD